MNTLNGVIAQLSQACAKLRSVNSYQEEFYDRVKIADPKLVERIEGEMGTAEYG